MAKARNAKAKHFGERMYSDTSETKTGVDTHYLGVIAELCVSKYFNSEMDKEIYEFHGDCGHDLVVGGKTIQVKTTTYTGMDGRGEPLLRAEVKKDKESIDIYLLVSVDEKFVYLVGWIDRLELIKEKPKRLCPKCPMNYIVSMEKLNPIKELNEP